VLGPSVVHLSVNSCCIHDVYKSCVLHLHGLNVYICLRSSVNVLRCVSGYVILFFNDHAFLQIHINKL
jgi:hypothetical protein